MPAFCVSCGAPMTGAFCNQCGARAVVPTTPAQPAPQAVTVPVAPAPVPVVAAPIAATPTAPTPVTQSSGIGKILLWVGGVLLLIFVLGVGAAVYGMYWVKHKVASYTSAVTGESSTPIKVVEKGNSCRLLSTADVQQVLGVTIEKSAEIMEDDTPGCAYFASPEAFTQLQRMAVAQARKQTEEQNKKPGPKTDNPLELLKDANQLEGIVKTLGLTQPSKDGRVFSFTIQRNSGDAWSAMRLTESTVPGFEEVAGVGDHAMIGSFGHAFYVQKGDAFIHLETTWVPDAKARGSVLGTKIVGSL